MTRIDAGAAASRIVEALEGGRPVAAVLLVQAPDPLQPGCRLLVTREGSEGSLGSPELDEAGRAVGRRALEAEETGPDSDDVEGAHTVELPDGSEAVLYVEAHHPSPELLIVGAGHIARPLCHLGVLLGYRVTVLDDRPEMATRERFPDADHLLEVDFDDPFAEVELGPRSRVVLVTRGHRYDYECLRMILAAPGPLPAYVGMIGSRRRVRATFHQLVEEGIPPERLQRVWSPIGLDVHAETPVEIAVCIAAEMILSERGGTGRPLRELERVLERFFSDD